MRVFCLYIPGRHRAAYSVVVRSNPLSLWQLRAVSSHRVESVRQMSMHEMSSRLDWHLHRCLSVAAAAAAAAAAVAAVDDDYDRKTSETSDSTELPACLQLCCDVYRFPSVKQPFSVSNVHNVIARIDWLIDWLIYLFIYWDSTALSAQNRLHRIP